MTAWIEPRGVNLYIWEAVWTSPVTKPADGNGSRRAEAVVPALRPFLEGPRQLGLAVVARLKGNLPELYQAARQRFQQRATDLVLEEGGERIELCEADDFDPWESLPWPSLRVMRYRDKMPAPQPAHSLARQGCEIAAARVRCLTEASAMFDR